jgi:hypothetical protein
MSTTLCSQGNPLSERQLSVARATLWAFRTKWSLRDDPGGTHLGRRRSSSRQSFLGGQIGRGPIPRPKGVGVLVWAGAEHGPERAVARRGRLDRAPRRLGVELRPDQLLQDLDPLMDVRIPILALLAGYHHLCEVTTWRFLARVQVTSKAVLPACAAPHDPRTVMAAFMPFAQCLGRWQPIITSSRLEKW